MYIINVYLFFSFRSVCWRALLGVLPQQTSSWLDTIREQRERYAGLKSEMISDPRQNKILDDDPLSRNDEVKLLFFLPAM